MNREKHLVREEVKNTGRFKPITDADKDLFAVAFKEVINKVDKNMEDLKDPYMFPLSNSENNVYKKTDYSSWTNSFWTGMVWLCYEMTGEVKYRAYAENQLDTYYTDRMDKKINTDDHDIGFIYTLSAVAAYQLTGNQKGKELSLQAAEILANRFIDGAGIIQNHGAIDDPKHRGYFIVDCSMNVPLLHWANSIEANPRYVEIAKTHMEQVAEYCVKEDGSSYHVCRMDDKGNFIEAQAGQGWSMNSCWARGQAWLIYGFTLAYQHTGDQYFLEVAKKVSNYFLNRLPKDEISYWDLVFTEGDQPRDSSAATIAICGLMELSDTLPEDDELKETYGLAAHAMLKTLVNEYTTKDIKGSNGLLQHAVYYLRGNRGVDECCLWGDYFYVEALMRALKPWKKYW